MNLLAL